MRELVCGKNSVMAAINNKVPLKVVYTTKPDLFENEHKFEVKHVDKKYLDNLTSENHQGFVAELKDFNYANWEEILKNKPQKILILDHIQDPHNLGAILRSANAFGFQYVILPKNRAAKINLSVLKVSSGGYVNLKIIRVNSLMDVITKLKKANFWIYGSALEKSVDVKKANINYPMALIFGNEAKGMSRTLLKHTDQNIFIPMKGTVQSLNVAVAAGILMFYL